MKRILILVVVVVLMFSFLFTGCPTEDGATTGLTDEEVSAIARASMGSGLLPMTFIFYEPTLEDGTYNSANLGDLIVLGKLVVSDGSTIYTFTDCGLDVIDPKDGIADMTLGGVFSVEAEPTTMIITYTDFTVIGTMPGTTTSIEIIVAGTLL